MGRPPPQSVGGPSPQSPRKSLPMIVSLFPEMLTCMKALSIYSVLLNLFSTTAHLFGTTQQTAHCISGTYFLYTTCMAYDLHNDVQLCI